MHPHASPGLEFAFVALAGAIGVLWVVAVGFVSSSRGRARLLGGLGFSLFAGFTWWLADTGVLRRFDLRPPPFVPFVLGLFALSFSVGFSRLGRRLAERLPVVALVGFQAFRLPLELAMHRAYEEGVMPQQMSYSGYNFDIVTGITAALLGLVMLVRDVPRWVVVAWNALGVLLLVNILGIAIASLPTFAAFGPDALNVWVSYPPFVWLPAVMVQAAVIGHVLVFRRLRLDPARRLGR